MTALETMREWLTNSPFSDHLNNFHIDYTDQFADNSGLVPSGLTEISRTSDILGNKTVRNQYNFALYTRLILSPGDDTGSMENAEWIMDFQEWIQEQSVLGLAPTFGDDPKEETMTASNGSIYAADDEGTALYVIQISAQFQKHYWRTK